jgi:hypothetical protein
LSHQDGTGLTGIAKVLQFYKVLWDQAAESYGSESSEALNGATSYVAMLADEGDIVEAEGIARTTLARWKVAFGVDDPGTMQAGEVLAKTLTKQAKFVQAAEVWRGMLQAYGGLDAGKDPRRLEIESAKSSLRAVEEKVGELKATLKASIFSALREDL